MTTNKNTVITYTFCECGENHVGNQQIGSIAPIGGGFTLDDFKVIKKYVVDNLGINPKNVIIKNLKDGIKNVKTELEFTDAHVLLIKGFVKKILENSGHSMNDLFQEVTKIKWDTKYYDTRRKKVLNKNARQNNVLADFKQKANYNKGKGTIIPFSKLPLMNLIRNEINKFGEKFKDMIAEGNMYSDGGVSKNGIGWHGDGERRRVVAIRIGGNVMPIYYQWYHDSTKIGKKMKINLSSGDMYIMSEKAVGTDWKKRKIPTLRHATGANKYTK